MFHRHRFKIVSTKNMSFADTLGQYTLTLLKCNQCTKTKIEKLEGHWDKETLDNFYG